MGNNPYSDMVRPGRGPLDGIFETAPDGNRHPSINFIRVKKAGLDGPPKVPQPGSEV